MLPQVLVAQYKPLQYTVILFCHTFLSDYPTLPLEEYVTGEQGITLLMSHFFVQVFNKYMVEKFW